MRLEKGVTVKMEIYMLSLQNRLMAFGEAVPKDEPGAPD